ncbi:MAG TPA: hypothetical protein VJ570_13735 [Holophagaceae bacterium]|nr:hypothetical protein [Holophagaceae bacterium]
MHPIIQKFIANQLPDPMVSALLGGALPVPPLDLLQALAHAALQPEHPHQAKAQGTFEGMPESLIAGVLLGPIEPADPLRLILRFRKEMSLLDPALLHGDITSAILVEAVPHLPGPALPIVSNNQVKWLERPEILDLLEEHPDCDYNLKRRIEEFRFDVLKQGPESLKQERLAVIDDVEAGRLDKAWADLPMPKEELPAGVDADRRQGDEPFEGEERRAKLGEEPILDEDGNPVSLSLTQRIMRLKTNQKIMLATKGGKEERTILIREANRLIQVAVIRNGRITEGEVAYISALRTVNEEVLRVIAGNRDWMKKYTIYKSLVMNPKTPLPIAMTHFKRLMEADIKLIMKDKNVPEMLRREAKRLLEAKAAGRPGS